MNAVDVDSRIRSLLANGEQVLVRELLVRHFEGKVSALCRGMVGNASTAEDLKQDTFERAFAGLDAFRGEASASTWLLRIARNRCIDHMRNGDSRLVTPGGDAVGDVPDGDERSIAEVIASLQRAEDALAILDSEDRALVLLHHVHDVSYAELAATFGVKEGTLRMRMARALASMRTALEHAEQLPARPFAPSPSPAALTPASAPASASTAIGPRIESLAPGPHPARRRARLPRAVLWAALASALGAFVVLWFTGTPAEIEPQAGRDRGLEAHDAEASNAEVSDAEASNAEAREASARAVDALAERAETVEASRADVGVLERTLEALATAESDSALALDAAQARRAPEAELERLTHIVRDIAAARRQAELALARAESRLGAARVAESEALAFAAEQAARAAATNSPTDPASSSSVATRRSSTGSTVLRRTTSSGRPSTSTTGGCMGPLCGLMR